MRRMSQLPALRDTAFLHARILEQAGVTNVYDGDDLVCDVSRNEKGLTVSRVYELKEKSYRIYKGVVVKLLEDRHYGFMNLPETGTDAFFHYHVFSTGQQAALSEGQEFSVEIKTDDGGRSQVRRVV
jgi:cold shock CspA family protein